MVNYETFSAIRLENLFPDSTIFPPFEANGERSFDTERMMGIWDQYTAPGVDLCFPAIAENSVGLIDIGPGIGTSLEKRPGEALENGNRLLEALGVPLRLGVGLDKLNPLTLENVRRREVPEKYSVIEAVYREGGDYEWFMHFDHFGGLTSIEIRRMDLVEQNDQLVG